MSERPDVPAELLRRIDLLMAKLPEIHAEPAWTGARWRVGATTVAHVFGGEDQRFRITFRAADDEVMAFEYLGPPYFRSGWGGNSVGMMLDDDTDFAELAELLTDSYCLQAPQRLVDQVTRP